MHGPQIRVTFTGTCGGHADHFRPLFRPSKRAPFSKQDFHYDIEVDSVRSLEFRAANPVVRFSTSSVAAVTKGHAGVIRRLNAHSSIAPRVGRLRRHPTAGAARLLTDEPLVVIISSRTSVNGTKPWGAVDPLPQDPPTQHLFEARHRTSLIVDRLVDPKEVSRSNVRSRLRFVGVRLRVGGERGVALAFLSCRITSPALQLHGVRH